MDKEKIDIKTALQYLNSIILDLEQPALMELEEEKNSGTLAQHASKPKSIN